MSPQDFEKRWAEFRVLVVDGLAGPEQVNDMRIAYIGGMVEMFQYLTTELSAEPNEAKVVAQITEAGKTLRTVAAQVTKRGFELIEGKHGNG